MTHHSCRKQWFQTTQLFGVVWPRQSAGFESPRQMAPKPYFRVLASSSATCSQCGLARSPNQQVRQAQDGELAVMHVVEAEMLTVRSGVM